MAYNVLKGNVQFINSTTGSIESMVDDYSSQTIAGVKTFSSTVTASGFYDSSGGGGAIVSSPINNLYGSGEDRVAIFSGSSNLTASNKLTFDGTTLAINGNLTASINISGAAFYGSAAGLTAIPAANLNGTVSAANINIGNGLQNSSTALAVSASDNSITVASNGISLKGAGTTSGLVVEANGLRIDPNRTTAMTAALASGDEFLIADVSSANDLRKATVSGLQTYMQNSLNFGGAAGSDTQVQFNSSGDFAGNSAFTFNTSTGVLTVSGVSSSANISGSKFYGDGSNLTSLAASEINGNVSAGNINIGRGLVNESNKLVVSASYGLTASVNGLAVTASTTSGLSATIGSGLIVSPTRATSTGSVADADEVLISDASDSYATKKASMSTLASYMQDELTFTAAGGSNTQVQYNNSNAFAGSSTFTFNSATNTLAVTDISSSGNISGSKFYGNGANLTGLPSAAISSYTNASNNRLVTSVDSSTVNAEANLSFDGNKLSATGQISASLGVTGSSLNTAATVINATHISSSLNVSGAAFFGSGAGLTGLPSAAISTYTNSGDNRIITSVNSSTVNAEASLTFDGSKLAVVGAISGSGLLESVGGAVLGGALLVTGSITGGASISGSGVISGKDLVIDDGRRIGIASDTDLMVLTDSQLRIKGTLTASAPIQGRSLTVAGGEVISKNGALGNITSATIGGPISGSGTLEAVGAAILGNTLSVTGSITSATSLGTATTIINSTHVSSSLNISGANFYGNGSNLSGLPSATVTSYTNSSNNRVLTSVDSETINGEANLTFDGNKLSATGQISASLGISGSKFMGDFFEGKTFETATTFINATHVSSSLNISGAAFFGSGAGLTGLPSAAITSYTNASNNRIITSVDSDTVNSEANLTFDGNKLSATGQISASLGVSGSRFIGVTFEGSGFETSTTFINSTHVSSSLNISGAAFYGDGSNLSGISAGGSSAYNSYTLNFTVTDSHDILGIVTTGSAITASLPTAATFDAGQKIIFKDVSGSCSGSNHIVISASQNHAGEKIDGQGVVKIETGYGALTLASDGVKSYYIVSTS